MMVERDVMWDKGQGYTFQPQYTLDVRLVSRAISQMSSSPKATSKIRSRALSSRLEARTHRCSGGLLIGFRAVLDLNLGLYPRPRPLLDDQPSVLAMTTEARRQATGTCSMKDSKETQNWWENHYDKG